MYLGDMLRASADWMWVPRRGCFCWFLRDVESKNLERESSCCPIPEALALIYLQDVLHAALKQKNRANAM